MNHAVLYVSDIDRSVEFWTKALDMSVVSRLTRANAAFLKLNHGTNDHDLGLFGLGADAPRPERGTIGLYHLAWQVDTIDELAAARETLIELGAHVGESDHGTTKSLYAQDPDGNEFEIMWMIPQSEWDNVEARGVAPIDLSAEVARWTGVSTAAELG